MTTSETNDRYAIYNGDCVEVTPSLPDNSVHLSVYSPPFCGLYNYSSDPRDMSNCGTPEEFFEHYGFIVKEIHRITHPGRMSAVHVCDIPKKSGGLFDLPGETIRLHQNLGWEYHARYAIWKEPLRVAIRTRSKGLTHRQIVKDSTESNNAGADYMLVFKKKGENKIPVTHPIGLEKYAGEREIPDQFSTPTGEVYPRAAFENGRWSNPQTNKLAHWIWQQYASAFWDDIRIGRVLPYKHAKDKEEEKHCHPLQLDVIERCVQLWSNPGEVVFTPYMGVGSEVYGAVSSGRKAIGIELKDTYFRQAAKNVKAALTQSFGENDLFSPEVEETTDDE